MSGLGRLLEEVANVAERAKVTLFLGYEERSELEGIRQEIRRMVEALSGFGIGELRLRLVGDWFFKREAHGRTLRFDQAVAEIDTGLEVLAGTIVYRRSAFTLKSFLPEHRRIEENLESRAFRKVNIQVEPKSAS